MTSKMFQTLHIWDTKLSADSVEWCPISPFKDFFVCGTYFLNENVDNNVEALKKGYKRTGNVTLFRVIKDKLEAIHSVDSPAILDMKWSFQKVCGNIALAAANAIGGVSLFYLENGFLKFISTCILKNNGGDFLILSLDWIKNDSSNVICTSDSQGNINLVKVANDCLQLMKNWKAHTLEAWTVCFDSFHPNNVYSGGDEGIMKVWDCRCEDVIRIGSSTKHSAGVTALSSNTYKENNLVSGSYDETVLFWDCRSWKAPVGSIAASGGIWRLKWEPRSRTQYLLAACIYGGFQIYDVQSYKAIADYKEHESLAYGADWCFLGKDELYNLLNCEEASLIATCSFYDHKLCVSQWNENPSVQSSK